MFKSNNRRNKYFQEHHMFLVCIRGLSSRTWTAKKIEKKWRPKR